MRRARHLGRRELLRSYLLTLLSFTFKTRRLLLLARLQKARALQKFFGYAHRRLSSSHG